VLKILQKNNKQEPLEAAEDGDLYRRFRQGDDRAFNELFRRHNPRLFLYCVKIVSDHNVAEDVTQETWEKVIAMRSGPDGEIRNVGGYLVRMARNSCIDHLRRSRRMTPTEEIDEGVTPMFAPAEPTELEQIAVEALERLPFDYREVLVLNLYCGYRYDEIAAMLDKTPDAIWARASRARTQLRRIVAASMEPVQGSPGTGAADKPMHQQRM